MKKFNIRTAIDEKLNIKPADLNAIPDLSVKFIIYPFDELFESLKNKQYTKPIDIPGKGVWFLAPYKDLRETLKDFDISDIINYHMIFVAEITDDKIDYDKIYDALKTYRRDIGTRQDINFFPDVPWLKEIRPENFKKYFNL